MRRVVSLVLIASFVSLFASSALPQKKVRVSESTQQTNTAKSTRFGNIAAYSDGKSTWLTWQMEAEFGNIGFNVYRISTDGTELLTPVRMVPGSAIRAREIPQYGETYYFYDREVSGSPTYYVESLSLKGSKLSTEPVYPRYVPSLAEFTGMTEREMELRGGVLRPTTLEDSALVYGKELAAEVEQYRQLADPSVHRMVISQPGVARIGVKRNGLHRVSRAQLEAAGFDGSSDSSLWQLYVEGVEQAMLIGPGQSYIEFLGKGTDTPETDVRIYYLMKGSTPGKRMESRVAPPSMSTVLSSGYQQTFVKKERIQYVEDVFNGDAENYFGRGIGSSPTAAPMTFNLTGVDFAQPTSTMQVRFQGYSAGTHLIEITLNDQVLAPASGFFLDNFVGNYIIPTAYLREGANSIKFRAGGPTGDFVFFDTLTIGFGRKFLAEQNTLAFHTTNYRVAKIDGFSSPNVRVFDVTRDGNPVLTTNLTFVQNGATYGTNMPASRGRSFLAVEDSAILAPDSVTPNNPELLGVPTNGANLIIIAYKDFLTQAETWADYRRSQIPGFTAKVVEVSDIYDEFNYGGLSSNSIQAFLQYAYQNWQTPPQYALLIGDASWDSRNYENQGFFNFVPPKIVGTVYSETASDEALADFNNDGLTEFAIGRIPARTVADVNTVFTKTVNWEASLTGNPLDRGALFAHDFNSGYTFDVMSNRLRNQLPTTMPSTFVFRGEANANTNLINAMNTGKYIVNYSGHGTAGSWGGNPLFFNVFSVPTLSDHNPSIYTMLTCLNGYYHWLYFPSIAEVLLNAPNKGAVATWASSGLTLPNYQEQMATRFYLRVGEGNILRIGDVIRDAKLALVAPFDSPDVRLSWGLLGDPMLKMR